MITNNSTIFLNDSQLRNLTIQGIPQNYPPGCNPAIDKIVEEGGKLICYHQVTINEALGSLTPAFILFFLISTYISFKIVFPYINKKIKERSKK